MSQGSTAARDRGVTFVPRSHAEVLRLFNGRDLIEPGLVQVSYWRPEQGRPDANADLVSAYGGVARL